MTQYIQSGDFHPIRDGNIKILKSYGDWIFNTFDLYRVELEDMFLNYQMMASDTLVHVPKC